MKYPKYNFDNPSDSKFCKEYGTKLRLSKAISVSHTKTIQIPTKELARISTFAGRCEAI
jgi:hypothetical protein